MRDEFIVCRGSTGTSDCHSAPAILAAVAKQLYSDVDASVTTGALAMGIGWLWHFTRRDGTESLRIENERRAAGAYRRWRIALELLERAARASAVRWKERRRGRIGARELARLPDYLLDDIGLRRDRSGVTVTVSRSPNHTLGYLPADRVVTFDAIPRVDAREDQPATRSRQRAA